MHRIAQMFAEGTYVTESTKHPQASLHETPCTKFAAVRSRTFHSFETRERSHQPLLNQSNLKPNPTSCGEYVQHFYKTQALPKPSSMDFVPNLLISLYS